MAAEAIGIGSDTTIIRIRNASLRGTLAYFLPVIGIATTLTFKQTLQEIASTTLTFAAAPLILYQLLLNHREQLLRETIAGTGMEIRSPGSVSYVETERRGVFGCPRPDRKLGRRGPVRVFPNAASPR